MTPRDLDLALSEAAAAVDYARTVRKLHARRTERGNPQREADIAVAIRRLRESMRPLRSYIGTFQSDPRTPSEIRGQVYAASHTIKRERQKLWKMKQKNQPEED